MAVQQHLLPYALWLGVGRFDGDVWLSAALYGGVRLTTDDAQGLGALEVRARYLDSAGFFVTGELVSTHLGFSLGVDLRPLFLARFLTGRTLSVRFWDLLVDSLGIDLGARLRIDSPDFASLIVGTGVDIPCYTHDLFRIAIRAAFRYGYTPQATAAESDWTLYGGLVVESHVGVGAARHER